MELCRVLKAESFHLKHSYGHVCVFDVLKTAGNLVFMLSAQFLGTVHLEHFGLRVGGLGVLNTFQSNFLSCPFAYLINELNAKAEKTNFTCLLRNNTKNRSISLIITFRVRTESARVRLIFSSLISSVLQGTLLWKTQDGNSHSNINYAFSERDDAVDE